MVPEAKYLESSFDIGAVREYIRGEANDALKELGIPLQVTPDDDGQGGLAAPSGISVTAQEAGVIAYSKGRQPLFELHETRFFQLVARIGGCAAAGLPSSLTLALNVVADDPSLRVAWPEVSIDLPGPDRDTADTFELTYDLTDPIELLMRRQGLTEEEAIEQYRSIQRRKSIAAALQADPLAVLPEPEDDQTTELPDDGDKGEMDGQNADMGIAADGSGVVAASGG